MGRVQAGDYYYAVYKDDTQPLKYDLSELDRVELLNVCFELLIKYKDWRLVETELLRLKVTDLANFK